MNDNALMMIDHHCALAAAVYIEQKQQQGPECAYTINLNELMAGNV